MNETQKKLNTAEAAEYLGVRPNTLESPDAAQRRTPKRE